MTTPPKSGRGGRGTFRIREALQQRGLSERSADVYTGEIWRLEQAMAARGYTLGNVPAGVLAEYVKTRPNSWSTLKLIRSSLSHYWSITGRKNPPIWVIPVPRKPRMRCLALEPAEAKRLAKIARQRGDREGLAVLFGLYAGLRREEISRVRWDDVSSDGWLTIMGKGLQPAKLPLHPAILNALGKIPRDTVWVFPGQTRKGPASPATVWTWVVRIGVQAGLPGLRPHVLRHTCLATANDNTGDLRAVQELARHARPETTAGYTRVTTQRLLAAVASLDY